MDSMNLLIFIVVASLGVVAVTVGLDAAVDYIGEKKREKAKRKEEKAKFDEWALRMLTIAGLHKNAHAIYRREPGSHRRVRV
jgi:hypothetical protein